MRLGNGRPDGTTTVCVVAGVVVAAELQSDEEHAGQSHVSEDRSDEDEGHRAAR
jgi:hypothetical protein